MIFLVSGSYYLINAQSAGKTTTAKNKLSQIEGFIVEDSSGKANGLVTIKSDTKTLTLFYVHGKFKITGAKYFMQGDKVVASYKPEKGDYDGVLVSIQIKK